MSQLKTNQVPKKKFFYNIFILIYIHQNILYAFRSFIYSNLTRFIYYYRHNFKMYLIQIKKLKNQKISQHWTLFFDLGSYVFTKFYFLKDSIYILSTSQFLNVNFRLLFYQFFILHLNADRPLGVINPMSVKLYCLSLKVGDVGFGSYFSEFIFNKYINYIQLINYLQKIKRKPFLQNYDTFNVLKQNQMSKSKNKSKIYSGNYIGILDFNPNDHTMNPQKHQILSNNQSQEQIIQLRKIDQTIKHIIRQKMFPNLIRPFKKLGLYSQHQANILTRKSVLQKRSVQQLQPLKKNNFLNDIVQYNQESQIQRLEDQKQQNQIKIIDQKRLQKKGNYQKQILVKIQKNNIIQLQNHFRQMIGIPNSALIYQYKISKQQIKNIFKSKNTLSQEILDKFFVYFEIPNNLHFKQYLSMLNYITNNTNLKQINFFIFQIIDQNKDGFITFDDIFQFLQLNNDQFEYIEHDIFLISQAIKNKKNNSIIGQRQPTVQQILSRNQQINIQQYRQLLKRDNKNIVNCRMVKSTAYHQSYQALEHEPSNRLKNSQIQYNKVQLKQNLKQKNNKQLSRKQNYHITIIDFNKIFHNQRPFIFYCILQILTGIRYQKNIKNNK